MKPGKICWFALLFTVVYGCKVPYQPPLSNATTGYLVVDGVINDANGSTDSTFIRLSRTSMLTASDAVIAELHAQVSVEDGQGFTAALKETTRGYYAAGPLGLDSKKQYRLRIKTTNGETYLSSMVSSTYSPPIDSVGYTVNGDQVAIYVNTHNPANNTRYYHWDYTETWEILPALYSQFMTNGTAIVPRDAAHQFPTSCWQTALSTNVILASTANLVNDMVYQAPIAYITGATSLKLTYRYSMLLKQYGLTQDAYTFWSQQQKNTEQLGSIFDAQPSQINGNIHSTTNPSEPVFGYISVTNVQTKRIYISRFDLPFNFITDPYSCQADTALFNPVANREINVQVLIPFNAPLVPLYMISGGYMVVDKTCVDCSLTGTKIKPSFWTGP